MKGLFNYDNPVWRFVGKFWDVFMLNILWLICSIPIFTIGASTTAVYYVTLRLVRDEDGYTFRSFFRSFKENFKQATIIWLIFLVTGIVLIIDLWFALTAGVFPAGTPRLMFTALFIGLLIVWLAMITYVFPILSRFYGTVKQTILNAFLLSVRYILYTIGMVAVDIGILYLTLTSMPFLMMFGLPLIAFANSYFLHQVFKKFIPEEKEDGEEVKPLFTEEDGEEDAKAALYDTFIRKDNESRDVQLALEAPEREADGEGSSEREAESGDEDGGKEPEPERGADDGKLPEREADGGKSPERGAESEDEDGVKKPEP